MYTTDRRQTDAKLPYRYYVVLRSRACVTRVLVLRYICVFQTFIVVFERSLYLYYLGYSLGTLVVR